MFARKVVSLVLSPWCFRSLSLFFPREVHTTNASRAYTTTPLSMEVPSIVDATAEPHRFSCPRYYMTERLY